MNPAHRSPTSLPAVALVLAVCAAMAATTSGVRADDAIAVTAIAVAGQPAPVEGRYLLFGDIDVDPVRRVTFTASLNSGRVGIFRTSFGVPVPIVLSGDPAPPDAGNRFFIPLGVSSNTAGDLAFISTLAFPDRAGVFLWKGGSFTTLALEGTPSPVAGTRYAGFDQVRLLESGEVWVRAGLVDEGGVDAGAAVIALDGLAPRAALAPGERYGGTRRINHVIQYDVNEAGEVAALVEVGDTDFLLADLLTEVVRVASAPPRTLASANASFSGGTDQVRHFAVAVDQVRIDAAGAASFFAATNNFPAGGFALNADGRLFDNRYLVRQNDPSPVSPGDQLRAFGAFGRSDDGLLAFHAGTRDAPAGAILVQRPGSPSVLAARIGGPRPGGGVYSGGFFHLDMNPQGAFVFTEFQGLIQTGVFLGRFLGDPAELVQALRALLESGGSRGGSGLAARLDVLEDALDDPERAALQLASLRQEVSSRSGRSIDEPLAEGMDALLADLQLLLGAPPRPAPRQAVDPAQDTFDTPDVQP